MDATITYDEVAALVGRNIPSLEPHPKFERISIRNSTMSLTTLVLCFSISQICFWDYKYVFHLGKVFYHLVEVILNLFASMFLTLCPNLSNFHTPSHVPQEMSHMASLVYYKIWDFCIFFLYCNLFSSSS
jgi:hypothetical protein